MKLKQIHRTSTFAWSPTASLPLLATGTVAGALDESFSNESQLEIWAPDFLDKDEFELGGITQNGPKGFVTDTARFNRLAWGAGDGSRSRGVIAAGMENGELVLWDPAQILAGAGTSESLILRNTIHTGPVRGLDFNPIQANLLASGGVSGEVYIWDLKDPSKPYTPTPGARSNKLDEITSVAWNQQVQYVLAGASSTGYTVVWDLRGKREVVALAYGGGAGTLSGQVGAGNASLAVGGRRGMSDIAWHPDNATRVVTASEDDSSPVIMVWDLRNARAPEKILTGHEKGVLSLSWCKQDADLLLSCGKDNRALCWNPQTSEIIGEIPSADNWAFQVDWCPRNPDLLATAFFDGTIGIHSTQYTNQQSASTSTSAQPSIAPRPDGSDIFDLPNTSYSQANQSRDAASSLSLKQPPKWLRRPISCSFGFGGRLVTVQNLASSQGKNQSSVVHLRNVVTEDEVVERVRRLKKAVDDGELRAFAEERGKEVQAETETQAEVQADGAAGGESWKALLSLFKADSREELVTLLGFSKAEIAARVAEALETLKASAFLDDATATSEDGRGLREPVVSFAEPTTTGTQSHSLVEDEDSALLAGGETEPSEFSASVTSASASDATSAIPPADSESTTTAPSLFGDDIAPGGQQVEAGDFFSSLGRGEEGQDAGSESVRVGVVPHTGYGVDSSVAATIGSRPSSVASETFGRSATFRLYPEDESSVDKLITKSLILGDFESAVQLCLATERFADAILLGLKGGPELLERTQKVYFAKKSGEVPYLRLLQSVVVGEGEGLGDVVQNADLKEWKEVFVVVCTFAKGREEFGALVEQLGVRLEEQWVGVRESLEEDEAAAAEIEVEVEQEPEQDGAGDVEEDFVDMEREEKIEKANEYRRNATLAYLAAAKLERLVGIWSTELVEEEERYAVDEKHENESYYSAHANALQSFIEKVTVFRDATKYEDKDLSAAGGSSEEGKRFKLAALYDRYAEYADLLASQGLLKEAAFFLALTPTDYEGSDLKAARERLLTATGKAQPQTGVAKAAPSVPAKPAVPSTYGGYAYPTQAAAGVQQPNVYNPYALAQTTQPAATTTAQPPNPYAPPPQPAYATTSTYQPTQPYATPTNLTLPPHMRTQPQPVTSMVPPPPPPGGRVGNGTASSTPPPPPPKRDVGGWNDAPVVSRNSPAPLNLGKPAAIMSPFPNTVTTPLPGSGYQTSPGGPQGPQGQPLPPPPRPGSVNRQAPPPPPPQGQRISPQQGYAPAPPAFNRPPSVTGQQGVPPPPPGRMVSPLQSIQAQGPYAPPPPRGAPGQGQTPPPPGPGGYRPPVSGPYARATPPPPGHGQAPPPPPGPPGPYAPPPQQQHQPGLPPPPPGPYAPPPQQQHQQQPHHPPPPPPYAPPPGAQRVGAPMTSPQAGVVGIPPPPPPVSLSGPPGPGGPGLPPPGPPRQGTGPPPPGPSGAGPSAGGPPPSGPPARSGPPPPKYPPGDRSHIPESARPIFVIISEHLNRVKQTTPPQQKRLVDDLERRINPLFDALNCETLSQTVVEQLLGLARAMEAHDRQLALAIHVDLLTRGSQGTDDIALWMSGIKQLILRL